MKVHPNMHGDSELERRGLRGICKQLFVRFEEVAGETQIGLADTLCVSAGPNRRPDRKLPDFEPPAYINCKLLRNGHVIGGPIGFYLYCREGLATVRFDIDGNPKVYVDVIDTVLNEAVARVFEHLDQCAAAA